MRARALIVPRAEARSYVPAKSSDSPLGALRVRSWFRAQVSRLHHVQVGLNLRDPFKLDFLIPQNTIEHLAALVQQVNQAVHLRTADGRMAALREPPHFAARGF
jgi:hypothetical protein